LVFLLSVIVFFLPLIQSFMLSTLISSLFALSLRVLFVIFLLLLLIFYVFCHLCASFVRDANRRPSISVLDHAASTTLTPHPIFLGALVNPSPHWISLIIRTGARPGVIYTHPLRSRVFMGCAAITDHYSIIGGNYVGIVRFNAIFIVAGVNEVLLGRVVRRFYGGD
jgi:hypothetical protein